MLPAVALLPWGDVVEDFLDGIGVSLGEFFENDGWMVVRVHRCAEAPGHSHDDRLLLRACHEHNAVGTEPTGAELVILRARPRTGSFAAA